MRRFLVQQNPHGFARLHAAADHRHQLGFDEVLALPTLPTVRTLLGGGAGGARRHPGGRRRGPAGTGRAGTRAGAGLPTGHGDFGVIHLPERLVGGADVALT